jgi:hypothetical protein
MKLQINTIPDVEAVFNKYPDIVRKKLLNLRNLIIETAREIEEISEIEETLKWGEPSYLVKNGSTIRIDWKEKQPEQYAIYFKCTSKLVPAFKSAFGDTFKYEGNRAIVFKMDDTIPKSELKRCIASALLYHKVKHLPDLAI